MKKPVYPRMQRNSMGYGMITNIDENMARLTGYIRKSGLEQNTLIIFMTDNGSSQACRYDLPNGNMRGCKGSPHEGGVRVPCFMRWPGVYPENTEIDEITGHVDILPTLAELGNASLPMGIHLDGQSLLPLVFGKKKTLPKRYFITHVGRWVPGSEPPKYQRSSIRSPKYRMVENSQLYDMQTDPAETTNIYDQYPQVVTELKGEYDRWWNKVIPIVQEPQRLKLGSEHENPSFLCCFDWRPSTVFPNEPHLKAQIWRQSYIKAVATGELSDPKDKKLPDGATGSWAVEFVNTGTYRFTLRKVPDVAPDELKRLKPGLANIVCGDIKETTAIPDQATSVIFEFKVNKGESHLECWFTGQRQKDDPLGAFFVEVDYLG
jgi:hypothetical protein